MAENYIIDSKGDEDKRMRRVNVNSSVTLLWRRQQQQRGMLLVGVIGLLLLTSSNNSTSKWSIMQPVQAAAAAASFVHHVPPHTTSAAGSTTTTGSTATGSTTTTTTKLHAITSNNNNNNNSGRNDTEMSLVIGSSTSSTTPGTTAPTVSSGLLATHRRKLIDQRNKNLFWKNGGKHKGKIFVTTSSSSSSSQAASGLGDDLFNLNNQHHDHGSTSTSTTTSVLSVPEKKALEMRQLLDQAVLLYKDCTGRNQQLGGSDTVHSVSVNGMRHDIRTLIQDLSQELTVLEKHGNDNDDDDDDDDHTDNHDKEHQQEQDVQMEMQHHSTDDKDTNDTFLWRNDNDNDNDKNKNENTPHPIDNTETASPIMNSQQPPTQPPQQPQEQQTLMQQEPPDKLRAALDKATLLYIQEPTMENQQQMEELAETLTNMKHLPQYNNDRVDKDAVNDENDTTATSRATTTTTAPTTTAATPTTPTTTFSKQDKKRMEISKALDDATLEYMRDPTPENQLRMEELATQWNQLPPPFDVDGTIEGQEMNEINTSENEPSTPSFASTVVDGNENVNSDVVTNEAASITTSSASTTASTNNDESPRLKIARQLEQATIEYMQESTDENKLKMETLAMQYQSIVAKGKDHDNDSQSDDDLSKKNAVHSVVAMASNETNGAHQEGNGVVQAVKDNDVGETLNKNNANGKTSPLGSRAAGSGPSLESFRTRLEEIQRAMPPQPSAASLVTANGHAVASVTKNNGVVRNGVASANKDGVSTTTKPESLVNASVSSATPRKRKILPTPLFENNEKPDEAILQDLLDQSTLLFSSISHSREDSSLQSQVEDLIEEIGHYLYFSRQDQPSTLTSNIVRSRSQIAQELETALQMHMKLGDEASSLFLEQLAAEYKASDKLEKEAAEVKVKALPSTAGQAKAGISTPDPSTGAGAVLVSAASVVSGLQERLEVVQQKMGLSASGSAFVSKDSLEKTAAPAVEQMDEASSFQEKGLLDDSQATPSVDSEVESSTFPSLESEPYYHISQQDPEDNTLPFRSLVHPPAAAFDSAALATNNRANLAVDERKITSVVENNDAALNPSRELEPREIIDSTADAIAFDNLVADPALSVSRSAAKRILTKTQGSKEMHKVQRALDQAEAALAFADSKSKKDEVNERRAKLLHTLAGNAFNCTIKAAGDVASFIKEFAAKNGPITFSSYRRSQNSTLKGSEVEMKETKTSFEPVPPLYPPHHYANVTSAVIKPVEITESRTSLEPVAPSYPPHYYANVTSAEIKPVGNLSFTTLVGDHEGATVVESYSMEGPSGLRGGFEERASEDTSPSLGNDLIAPPEEKASQYKSTQEPIFPSIDVPAINTATSEKYNRVVDSKRTNSSLVGIDGSEDEISRPSFSQLRTTRLDDTTTSSPQQSVSNHTELPLAETLEATPIELGEMSDNQDEDVVVKDKVDDILSRTNLSTPVSILPNAKVRPLDRKVTTAGGSVINKKLFKIKTLKSDHATTTSGVVDAGVSNVEAPLDSNTNSGSFHNTKFPGVRDVADESFPGIKQIPEDVEVNEAISFPASAVTDQDASTGLKQEEADWSHDSTDEIPIPDTILSKWKLRSSDVSFATATAPLSTCDTEEWKESMAPTISAGEDSNKASIALENATLEGTQSVAVPHDTANIVLAAPETPMPALNVSTVDRSDEYDNSILRDAPEMEIQASRNLSIDNSHQADDTIFDVSTPPETVNPAFSISTLGESDQADNITTGRSSETMMQVRNVVTTERSMHTDDTSVSPEAVLPTRSLPAAVHESDDIEDSIDADLSKTVIPSVDVSLRDNNKQKDYEDSQPSSSDITRTEKKQVLASRSVLEDERMRGLLVLLLAAKKRVDKTKFLPLFQSAVEEPRAINEPPVFLEQHFPSLDRFRKTFVTDLKALTSMLTKTADATLGSSLFSQESLQPKRQSSTVFYDSRASIKIKEKERKEQLSLILGAVVYPFLIRRIPPTFFLCTIFLPHCVLLFKNLQK